MSPPQREVVSELLYVDEYAAELRVDSKTVRRWIDHVRLPSGHIRIPIEALPRLQRARLDDGHRRRDRRELGGVA